MDILHPVPEDLSVFLSTVSDERLENDVRRLAVSPRHSGTSAEGHRDARLCVAETLQKLGLEVHEQPFDAPAIPGGRPGVNVVARKPGPDAGLPAVLVGAHYDTVIGSPGADDNASGLAIMLECARALAPLQLQCSLEFAAFDQEEIQAADGIGLYGSTAFVRSLEQRQRGLARRSYSGVFILETAGFTTGAGGQRIPPGLRYLFPGAYLRMMARRHAGDFAVVVSAGSGNRLARRFERAAARAAPDLPVLTLAAPRLVRTPRNLLRSDHAPFWRAGVPAVMIGDTANFRNPNYHLPSDTPDTLDYGFMAGITRAVLAAVISGLNGEERR